MAEDAAALPPQSMNVTVIAIALFCFCYAAFLLFYNGFSFDNLVNIQLNDQANWNVLNETTEGRSSDAIGTIAIATPSSTAVVERSMYFGLDPHSIKIAEGEAAVTVNCSICTSAITRAQAFFDVAHVEQIGLALRQSAGSSTDMPIATPGTHQRLDAAAASDVICLARPNTNTSAGVQQTLTFANPTSPQSRGDDSRASSSSSAWWDVAIVVWSNGEESSEQANEIGHRRGCGTDAAATSAVSAAAKSNGNDNAGRHCFDGSLKTAQMSIIAAKLTVVQSKSGSKRVLHHAKSWIHVDQKLHPCEEIFESAREDGVCVVCLDRPAAITLMPCGHTSVCGRCILHIDLLCPMCRQKCTSTLYQRN